MLSKYLPNLTIGTFCLMLATPGVGSNWPCYSGAGSTNWLDRGHGWLSGFVCEQTRSFDALFEDTGSDELATSQVTLLFETQFRQQQEPEYRTRVRVNLALPRTEARWRLLFEGEETGQLNRSQQLLVSDPDNRRRDFLAALVWTLQRLDIEGRVGLKMQAMKPDPFVQLRQRYQRSLLDNTALRLSQSVRWQMSDRWLSTTRADVCWHGNQGSLGWYNSLQAGNKLDSLDWSSGLSHHWSLTQHLSVHSFVRVNGNLAQSMQTMNLGFQLRRKLLRSWLLYELEPVLSQPLVNDAEITPQVNLGLEVQFGRISG